METQVLNSPLEERGGAPAISQNARPVPDPPVDRRSELIASAADDLTTARYNYEAEHNITNKLAMEQAQSDLAAVAAPRPERFLAGLPFRPRYIPWGTWHRREKMRRQASR